MKFDILKWAYEAELPTAIKSGPHAVLIALAYSAHFKTEACFPSIQRLSHLTRLKGTAVKSAIRILKQQGLITVISGKGAKKSNRYKINYAKTEIPRKSRDVNANVNVDATSNRTEYAHENGNKQSESDLVNGRIETTNKEHINTATAVCVESSSNSLMSAEMPDDDVTHKDVSGEFKVNGSFLLLGNGDQKAVGDEAAKALVERWWRAIGHKKFRYDPTTADELHEAVVKDLSDAIALYVEPPKVGYNDIDNLLNLLKRARDWQILQETTKNIAIKAMCERIENPKAYILKSVRENIANGTANKRG